MTRSRSWVSGTNCILATISTPPLMGTEPIRQLNSLTYPRIRTGSGGGSPSLDLDFLFFGLALFPLGQFPFEQPILELCADLLCINGRWKGEAAREAAITTLHSHVVLFLRLLFE